VPRAPGKPKRVKAAGAAIPRGQPAIDKSGGGAPPTGDAPPMVPRRAKLKGLGKPPGASSLPSA